MKLTEALLAISLVANGYFLVTTIGEDEGTVTDVSAACNDAERYTTPPQPKGGLQIPEDEAAEKIRAWNANNEKINYCTISKIAVDSIFASDLTANALKINIGLNSDGKAAFIVSGVATPSYAIQLLDNPTRFVFETEDNCPENCP